MGGILYDRSAVDRCFSKTETLLDCIVVTPHDGKYGTVTIYDGESAQDKQVLLVQSGTTETKVVKFDPPLFLARGLFIDIGEDVDDCLVQYHIGKP